MRIKLYTVIMSAMLMSVTQIGCAKPLGKQSIGSKESDVVMGADRFTEYLPSLSGKRVGLVVNQTSLVNGVHLVDTLVSLNVNVVKVFAPEHGFRGDHSDGAKIKDGVDPKSGLPIVSLYGKYRKPSDEMLNDLDIVIFDIQDVGVRFYTFISTMHYMMETCAENGKEMIVLDRPNPNGFYIDGPVLEPEYSSFIGMHPIPIVHGLTVGELAMMINGERWLKNEVRCSLQVVTCKNYDHQTLYQLPVRPSPNLPNMNSIYLYPYLGLFEGTRVSIGRGTGTPFQVVGHPQFDGEYSFTPHSIPGVSDHPKFQDKTCYGYVVNEVNDSSFFNDPHLNLDWLIEFYGAHRAEDGDFFRDFFYKLSGTKALRQQLEQGMTEAQIRATWEEDLAEYRVMRKKYLLYP